MKAAILASALALLLAGCGAAKETPPVESTPPAVSALPAEPTPVPTEEYTVSTEDFTLTLPEEWREVCLYECYPGEAGDYTLAFYEKKDFDRFGGGWLFSIHLFPVEEDYTVFPDYEELGHIVRFSGNRYNLVVGYPTDVQFDVDTAEVYHRCMEEIPAVLESVVYDPTCTHSPTPLPIEAADLM